MSRNWFTRLFFRSESGSTAASATAPATAQKHPPTPAESTNLTTVVPKDQPRIAIASNQMFDRENNFNPVLLKVGNVQSIIAADVEIVGGLNLKDSGIRIQGIVNGDVTQEGASLVIVDKHAKINGNIRARYLLVLGEVKGSIRVERLVTGASASIEGDIVYRNTFAPVAGAKIKGSVQQQDEAIFPNGAVTSLPPSEHRKSEDRVVDAYATPGAPRLVQAATA